MSQIYCEIYIVVTVSIHMGLICYYFVLLHWVTLHISMVITMVAEAFTNFPSIGWFAMCNSIKQWLSVSSGPFPRKRRAKK